MSTTNENHETFEQWYAKADRICQSIAGVGIDDLPDGNSWDAWSSEATPYDYVYMMLEEEGYPFEDSPPAPAPAPRPSMVYGGHDVEHIRTEGGKIIVIERNRAANGKHGRAYVVTEQEIDKEQYR